MATTLQLRRGTAAEAAAFTGAVGELFIDVQNKLVYLHDGATAGGVLVGGSGGGAAVVSGTVTGNTLTLTNSDTSTVNINVATLAQDTDTNTYVTSATVAGSTITLHNNNGSTVDIQLPSSVTGFLPGEVQEDMLPQFDAVYDLGSPTERWFDVNVSNSVTIGDTTLATSNGKLTANTEVVATSLTSSDLVTDEALIGTVLHSTNTITPEGTPGEYVDAKGTLVIDGNTIVSDNLSVRNQINLVQMPVKAGTVIDTTYTPTVTTPVVIDNGVAMNKSLTGIYWTSNGSQNTAYFNSPTEASKFYDDLRNNTTATLVFSASGMQYTWVFQPYSVSYNNGSTSVQFYAGSINGMAPWDIGGSWNTWYYPWWSGSNLALVSLTMDSVTPAQYAVNIGGELPSLGGITNLFINGSATTQSSVTYTSLSSFAHAVIPTMGGADGMHFSYDGSLGEVLWISSMWGSTYDLVEALAASPTVTITNTMSGLSWVIDPSTVQYSMPLGGVYVLGYTVVSASDPQYPTPRSYQSSFSDSITTISYTSTTSYLAYLSSNTTSLVNGNVLTSQSDITSLFNAGDIISYTLPTTSIVFGDTSSAFHKAITFNETTGAITYDGLVTAINYNADTHTISSSNAFDPSTYQYGIAIGSSAQLQSHNSIVLGSGRTKSQYNIAIGSQPVSGGQYSTYVGNGGEDMGGQYHQTVIGMYGTSSSGWMWGSGRHNTMLGVENMYLQNSGDYATIINGCEQSSTPASTNLIGGSTWFAPQDRHGELKLSAYQYFNSSGATTCYPQFGIPAGQSLPFYIQTNASTSRESTLWLSKYTNQLTQGKVTVTIMSRNSDDYGIYEINFIARNNNAGTASIVSQSTTTVATGGSAASYWNAPTAYLSGTYLQMSLAILAASSGRTISVHVGGDVRISSAY